MTGLDYLTLPIREYVYREVQRVRARAGSGRAVMVSRVRTCARAVRPRPRARRAPRATRAGPSGDSGPGDDGEPGGAGRPDLTSTGARP